MHTPTVDLHSENYYPWSPYAWVGDNPMRITDPTGMDWYEDEDGNAMWRRSQDEEYTDDDGRVWKNMGTEYLHVRGNRATLFSQGTNDEGESQKDADREAVLGWLSTDASRAAAKEWGRDSSLTNWIKFCVTEVLGQYTDPMRVVNGLSVGVAGYSSMLRNSPKTYAPRVRVRGVQDPTSHNFPYSFDDMILSTKAIPRPGGYNIYRLNGSMNGKSGVYEIGVDKKGVIDHRFFRPN